MQFESVYDNLQDPAAATRASADHTHPRAPRQGVPAPIRVFLIDAHRLVRDGVKLNLASSPEFKVIGEASSVTEASSQLADQADIVVMDIGPEELGGCDLETVLQEFGKNRVIVLSWRAPGFTVRKALGAGARGFVLKDAPGEHLLDAVRTVYLGGVCLGAGVEPSLMRKSHPEGVVELSPRERQVLRLVGLGQPSKLIARALNLSVRTVESHRQNIKRKLLLDSSASLVKYAVEQRVT